MSQGLYYSLWISKKEVVIQSKPESSIHSILLFEKQWLRFAKRPPFLGNYQIVGCSKRFYLPVLALLLWILWKSLDFSFPIFKEVCMLWKCLPILAVLITVSNISYLQGKEDEWCSKEWGGERLLRATVTRSERFASSHGDPQHLGLCICDVVGRGNIVMWGA